MTLTWQWMLENSDAQLVLCHFGPLAASDESKMCERALERHYGADRLRAMREYANLARSPEDGWRAAVQAVRDGDPTMMLE